MSMEGGIRFLGHTHAGGIGLRVYLGGKEKGLAEGLSASLLRK